ncbi:MAG: hypothetical protein B1H04_04330, partial [Planctomycetales bacterium 4484_123]
LALAAAALAGSSRVLSGPATPRPAATAPSPPLELALPTQPAPKPIIPARTVQEALAYDRSERAILEDVRDRDGQLDSLALSVLLRRAAMLPAGPAALAEADRPNVKNLWREPGRYRGRLIRIEGAFIHQQDWSRYASPTSYYAGPVYMVHLRELATGEFRPLIVMLPYPPPERIAQGRRIRLAGLFYKLVTLPEDPATGGDPAKTHEYPVIIARDLGLRGWVPSSTMPTPVLLLVGLVVLLLVVFVFIWRRAARVRRRGPEYKPLRFEAGPVEGNGAEQAGDVDERLVREVQAYRRESGRTGEGTDADCRDHCR